MDDVFGGALGDELAAVLASFGTEIEDPIGGFDDVEVMLDDEEGVTGIDEFLEDGEEVLDVGEMETGGGFVEDEELSGFGRCGGRGEELAEFEALGLAAGEGVEWLAELEVAETDLDEGREEFDNLLMALGVGGRQAGGFCVKVDGIDDGEMEDVVDGFSEIVEIQGGGFVTLAVAIGAGDVEVGEELHLDFFKAVSGATVAAAGPGVEGEEASGQLANLGLGCAGEKLANRIEGSEENSGGGARGAGDGGLIDEFDAGEVLGAFELFNGSGIALGFLAELAGKVEVEHVVSEGGFPGAGYAGEDVEETKREIDIELLEIVARSTADLQEFLAGLAAGGGEGDGFLAGEPREGALWDLRFEI